MSLRRFSSYIVALLVGSAAPLLAQSDVLRGRITGPDGAPLENAKVTATAFGGDMSRSVNTNADGRYTIIFNPAQGNYLLSVAAIGYQPLGPVQVQREVDEAVLVRDFQMGRNPVVLNTVRITADRQRVNANDEERRSGTGSNDRNVNMGEVPITAMGDLAAMAASLPGVTYMPGADGAPAGFSVLGLEASQNLVTLNGLSMEGMELPREAMAGTRLSTNPFNPAQGGFSGAALQSSTRGGTNYIQQNVSLTTNAKPLQFTDAAGRQLGSRYNEVRFNGSRSGAITFDKTYYAVSGQFTQRTYDLSSLLNTDGLALQRLGLAEDSVSRLLSLLDQQGIPVFLNGIPDDRTNQSGSSVVQFNFNPSGTANYAITATGGFSRQLASNIGSQTVPTHGGESRAFNGSLSGRNSFYFGSGFLNESNVGVSGSTSNNDPYLVGPDANIRVTSAFDDGSSSVAIIQVGGNSGLPTATTNYTIQGTNSTSWFTMNNRHRFQFQAEARYNRYSQDQNRNQFGTFTYQSLADFEANRPSSYSRLLQPAVRTGDNIATAFSFSDSYRPSQRLQLTMGGRADVSRYNRTPRFNEKVEQLFGISNTHVPTGVYFSPRFGFSWTYGTGPQIAAFQGAARGSRGRVTGGVGMFQNVPGSNLISQALENTGLPSAVQQISCIGGAVPSPDWDAFLRDQGLIPTTCADGSSGTVNSSSTPNVSLFDNGYTPSRSWRANLAWSTPVLNNGYNVTLNGTYSLNMNQQGTIDLNFDPTPEFTLANEGGRPVFVPASSIVTASGSVPLRASRKTNDFSRVSSYVSDLRSVSRQMLVSVSPARFTTGLRWSASYVLQDVRELTRGFNGNTASNPLDRQWSNSSNSSTHQFNVNLNYSFKNAVNLSLNTRVSSGTRFTPMVVGDVNGDGMGNDRAFVFDPATTTDPALAQAMRNLIDENSGSVKECLIRQLGTVAGRNSCTGPWYTTMNASVSLISQAVKLPQRATVRFQLSNPLTGLDALFHGWNDLHGWGAPPSISPQLLYVRGFDPATRKFNYEVNNRFGKSGANQTVRVAPFAITMDVRIDVGPERERQRLMLDLLQGRGRDGLKRTEAQLRNQYRNSVLNPFDLLLRQSDTLKLTLEQADSIATLNVKFNRFIDSTWTPVAKYLADLPDKFDEDDAWQKVRDAQNAVINRLAAYGPGVKAMLTKEQTNLVPAFLMIYLDEASIRALRPGASNARERLGGFGGGGGGRG